MLLPFVDTNIFLRHLRGDHPDFSPRATAYLDSVERGEVKIRTSDTVVFETVFTLERFYRGCINKTLHFIFTQSNALSGGSVPHNHITFLSRLPATRDNLQA